MFKRFKDWLIHKLGGYTEDEFTAAINVGNATAETAQKLAEPKTAAKVIKQYCANRADCEGCELHNAERCKLSNVACPEYWEA